VGRPAISRSQFAGDGVARLRSLLKKHLA
jgi:hypothetical protein